MLDRYLAPLTRRPLAALASPLARWDVRADTVTLTAFAIGLLAVPLLALNLYPLALAAILLNRLGDGLDGALARHQGITDSGGFLDITCDFIFYAAVVLGFALADPTINALPAAFLLFCFMGTGSSFLAFAVMAGKRGIESPVYRYKSLYYMGGITEGSETLLFFILLCLWPHTFSPLAWGFGSLCLLTTLTRILGGVDTLRRHERAINDEM